MVVEEQTEAHEPGRPEPRAVRQDEAQRPDEMRRRTQQHLALDQRLADQAEGAVLEIAQAAVDQFGRGRGSRRGEIPLLDQEHGEAPAGGITCDGAAVDPAAHDREIERPRAHFRSPPAVAARAEARRRNGWAPLPDPCPPFKRDG